MPESTDCAVYAAVLAEGGRVWFRDVLPEDAPAVLRLLGRGLLVHHTEDGTLTAVNPRSVVERVGAELRWEGVALITGADLVPTPLQELIQAYDAAPRCGPTTGVQYVQELAAIRSRLLQVDQDCREEALAAQPGGKRTAAYLAHVLTRGRRLLENGATIRTLYQPSAKQEPATVAFAVTISELGERIRVLDEPFTRLLVFDRRVAVIPAEEDNSAAAFVEDPVVIDLLVNRFERDWERAERVNWRALVAGDPEPTVHEQVGRLLARGHTQKAVASRLGLSERTVAGHIARLRELYDADTLYQLGWQMRAGRD
ncbi:LuxR family transcriptional regulator [Kitasatospora sp. NPDC096147]|uniref:LuxR family transcriptional regulator n=1 Tax=Kitasatospora sp. NPDC096147 TaxID=3364093 RepID=UPI00380EF0D0